MARYLIIGASGQIGGALLQESLKANYDTLGTSYKQNLSEPNFVTTDILSDQSVKETISNFKPDVVFACAALANVDYCQTHPEESRATNLDGIKRIAKFCNEYNSRLIFLSTDYVFNGKGGPYKEDAIADPINYYGEHKLLAEQYVKANSKNYLIVRTTITFGKERVGKNFYLVLKSKLSQGEKMKVPTDQYGSPSYNKSIAQALVELGQSDIQGVLNVSSETFISRYEFALLIARVFDLNKDLIIPVTTPELNQAAMRPMKAGLIIDKAKSILTTKLMTAEEALLDLKSQSV
ncbi:MAG: SDR family oxidoreductase [Candidatus Melainabacteria bacterium]|nr:SDR family oxidoreductase [Candidatus Melainabacteria bacterium]